MDIREILQRADKPTHTLNKQIGEALKLSVGGVPDFTSDYNYSIRYIESKGYDWIMGNVNGQIGGTPYACVGCPEDKASFGATPLISLWLSYFRLELSDERERTKQNNEK